MYGWRQPLADSLQQHLTIWLKDLNINLEWKRKIHTVLANLVQKPNLYLFLIPKEGKYSSFR